MTETDVATYCREIESHLCRKNDGHLIRIVGPSFDAVSRWAATGIPLKVVFAGIDRYFERYHRKGVRRRPVKIDFCDADVLDVFDEWRRATGVSMASGDPSLGTHKSSEPDRRHGTSLPEHLERVLTRLSSLRATNVLPPAADPIVDSLSNELDRSRKPGGLRGDDRNALLERLQHLDDALIAVAVAGLRHDMLEAARHDAELEIAPFRATMDGESFARAQSLALANVLRDRFRIPVIAYS